MVGGNVLINVPDAQQILSVWPGGGDGVMIAVSRSVTMTAGGGI